MTEKPKFQSLVPRLPDGAVTKVNKGRRLISPMNEDLLPVIVETNRELAPVMRRLGDFELHEDDYRQLHIWARDFTERGDAITALQLANSLAVASQEYFLPWIVHGRIISANFSLLRHGYEITQLSLTRVPALVFLNCSGTDLTKLNLSTVPELAELSCNNCELTELALSNLTSLEELDCSFNFLSTLSLLTSKGTELTKLKILNCAHNKLTDLLSIYDALIEFGASMGKKQLTELYCNYNQLTELDLNPGRVAMVGDDPFNPFEFPELTTLWCDSNQLTELDVSCTPKLTELSCSNNQLTGLRLSVGNDQCMLPVWWSSELTKLSCFDNKLTELDVSELVKLKELSCHKNQLTKLDIRECRDLTYLRCDQAVNIIKNSDQNLKVERV